MNDLRRNNMKTYVQRFNDMMDTYESPKILAGPHRISEGADAWRALREDRRYTELLQRIESAGLPKSARWNYVWRAALILAGYFGCYAYVLTSPPLWQLIIASIVIGVCHLWGSFIAHDASHGAVSKTGTTRLVVGHFFDTFMCAFAFSYFQRNHDLHHYHTNELDYDPGTYSPMFCLHRENIDSRDQANLRIVARQHLLIPLLYPLWTFSLRLDGLWYALRNRRKCAIDLVLLISHAVLWGPMAIYFAGFFNAVLAYLMMSMVSSIYLAVIIPVNHIGTAPMMATDTPFLEQQSATSRNIATSALGSLLFLGLDSQIEHHLLPWLPHMFLRDVRPIVKSFCHDHGLAYEEVFPVEAQRRVWSAYVDIARLAANRLATIQHRP